MKSVYLKLSSKTMNERKILNSGRKWILSSGDMESQNSLWLSWKFLGQVQFNCRNLWAYVHIERDDEELEVPQAVKFYNQYMGEVDSESRKRTVTNMNGQHQRLTQRTMWAHFELYALVNPAILMAEREHEYEMPQPKCRLELIKKCTKKCQQLVIARNRW